jgi:CBS domain containing-hemolysin-like protein
MFDYLVITGLILLGYSISILLNIDIVPEYPTEYELKRRAREGDGLAKKRAWIKKHSSEVELTYKVLYLLLQGLFILVVSIKLNKVWPALLILLSGFLVIKFIQTKKLAPKMFSFWDGLLVKHMQATVKFLRPVLRYLYPPLNKDEIDKKKYFYTEDEFVYRFGIDSDVLSEALKNKVGRMLNGDKTRAKEIMLDINLVPKVDVNLSLTPIIYDELHKKGYDMAVVFQGAEDNLVGLLYLSGAEAVEQLNSASSIRVGDKMEQGLQYVTEDVKLNDLISGFLQGGQNAVLVTGPGGRVSGVITARKLLGWISGV